MAAIPTRLITVEEFSQLPEDNGAVYHELRHGEIAIVTRPKLKHFFVQRNLRRLLENVAERGSVVDIEFPFRALPEYELRVADFAWISAERLKNADPDSHFQGTPELVIEVLSPSNSAAEIHDREKLSLDNGAREFWVVDPDRRQVKISTPDGHTVTWESGQEIPLPLFGNARLAVNAIFE
jgi:Uma2 family endonuclease